MSGKSNSSLQTEHFTDSIIIWMFFCWVLKVQWELFSMYSTNVSKNQASLWWHLSWWRRFEIWLKYLWQMPHWKGFSPVCRRMWFLRCCDWMNPFPQRLQTNGRSPVWMRRWVVKCAFWRKDLLQYWQTKGFSPVWHRSCCDNCATK